MSYRRAAFALLLFLFAANVYRAASQAITVDEAFAYLKLMDGPASLLFTTYDACHHVLQSYLGRLSVSLFGVSAFSLRLPTLLGGALYFVVAYRFCLWLFGAGLRFFLAVALLCLNPFVLDFLIAARGYGLALAFLFLAFWKLARFCAGDGTSGGPLLLGSGLSLSASIASNLTMLFPALALALLTAFLVIFQRRGGMLALQRYLAAVFVPAFLLMILPLSHAAPADFYYGEESLKAGLNSLAALSLDRPRLAVSGGILLLVALFPAAALAGCLNELVRGRFRKPDRGDAALFLSGAAFWVTLAGLFAAHWLFQVRYPLGRTGIYLVLLFSLHILAAVQWSAGRQGVWTWNARALLGFAGALVCVFALGFRTSYFAEWDFCRLLKPMLARIERDRPPGRATRIGGSFEFETCVNFYREKRRLTWLAPVLRQKMQDGDFYLFTGDDRGAVASKHLRVLLSDPVSKAVLAGQERR